MFISYRVSRVKRIIRIRFTPVTYVRLTSKRQGRRTSGLVETPAEFVRPISGWPSCTVLLHHIQRYLCVISRAYP